MFFKLPTGADKEIRLLGSVTLEGIAPEVAFRTLHDVDPHESIFFEDLARNLAPAKDIGFTTVLVHSEKDWSHEPIEARPASLADVLGDDGQDHIDYVTGDLAAFLEAALDTL